MKNKLKWIFLNKNENFLFISRLRLSPLYMVSLLLVIAISPVHAIDAEEKMTNLSIQETVSGIVTDDAGIPLPGVSVIVQGTTTGAATDFDGKYSLNASTGDILEFSYVGFKTQTITVGPNTNYNIALVTDNEQLDEVVVVGYGTQKKSSVTGSVATITSEKLTETPVTNATQLFAGQTTGVITRQISSEPGNDGSSISIRGFGGALILVDGIQQNLSTIDPNDIESISILKDAAAAVYGISAGSGVVLVTTKRGKKGKIDISLHSNTSFQNPTRFQNRVTALEYLKLGIQVDGLDIDGPAMLELYENGEKSTNTDWYNTVFTSWTPLIQHNLSARGGSEDIKYFASLGLSNQESAYRSGDLNFRRHNGRINVDAKINDKLSASFDMSYRLSDREAPRTSPSDMFNLLHTAQPIHPAILPDPDRAAYSGFSQRSPYAVTQRKIGGFNDQISERTSASIELKYNLNDFIEGLSSAARFDYYSVLSKTRTQGKPFGVYEYVPTGDPNDPIYKDDYPYIQQAISGGTGNISENRTNFDRQRSYFRLDYKKSIGNHNFKALALTEYIEENSGFLSASGQNLLAVSVPYFNSVDPTTIIASNGESASKKFSYVGRVNWDYNEKYFVEAAMRIDKSWKFIPGSRTGYFPGLSLGWALSKENFLKNSNAVNFLKLRASYSETGNDGVGAFSYLNAYGINNPTTNGGFYLMDDTTGIINDTRLANEDTTWLTYKLANIGLDGRLWNGLLGFEFDVFYRLEDGIFATLAADYPQSIGATLPAVNLNQNDDKGFEILLTHKNRISDDFKYNVSANFTYSQKRALKRSEDLSDDPEEAAIQRRQGFRTNRFFGFKSDGLFNSQEEIDNHADQDAAGNSTIKPGDIKYIDQNGDGFIDFKDNVEIGFGATPDISYGLNLGATYKNFSVSALFQGAARFNTYFAGSTAGPFSNTSIPFDHHYKYSWTPDPNDPNVNINPDAELPYITGSGLNQNSLKTSDFWLRDNDYIRLKTLNINYSFSKDFLKGIGFKSLDIYAAATNLITWDKLGIYGDSFDPETRSGTRAGATGSTVNGQNGRSYPIQQTITMGVKVSL